MLPGHQPQDRRTAATDGQGCPHARRQRAGGFLHRITDAPQRHRGHRGKHREPLLSLFVGRDSHMLAGSEPQDRRIASRTGHRDTEKSTENNFLSFDRLKGRPYVPRYQAAGSPDRAHRRVRD